MENLLSLNPYLSHVLKWVFLPMMILEGLYLQFFQSEIFEYYAGDVFTSFLLISILVTIIASLLLTAPHYLGFKFQDKFYAKINGSIGKRKDLKITNFPSKDFTIYPMDFRNVFMHYKLYGDASKYIKNFKVIKLSDDKTYNKMNKLWAVHFIFKRICKKGIIELRYV